MLKRLSTRERVLLVVLVLAAVLVLWYLTGRDGPGGGGGQEGQGEQAAAERAPMVRMDLLAGLSEAFDVGGRDLFKYSKRPPTAAELAAMNRQREEAIEARKKAAEARKKAANRPKPPPEPRDTRPRTPRITFQYLGNIGPKDDRIAVFADGDEIMVARVGEVVRKEFKVVEIDYQSVVMGFTRPEFADRTESLTMANK
jgi:hypothetical protein